MGNRDDDQAIYFRLVIYTQVTKDKVFLVYN